MEPRSRQAGTIESTESLDEPASRNAQAEMAGPAFSPTFFGIPSKLKRFSQATWLVLGYTLFVILWGAFVRATVSGDGCGAHWPTCQGDILPSLENSKTLIEFIHRVTSGLVLPLTLGLWIWAWRAFEKGHPARKAAFWGFFFTLTEAAIGAKLVLFGWVARDPSIARAVVMSLHLVNTFMLLAALVLTAYFGSGGARLRFRAQGSTILLLSTGLLGVLLLAISGAINALGDTIRPAQDLAQGIARDFAPDAHFSERLRLAHPLIAVSIGMYLVLMVGLVSRLRPCLEVKKWGGWVAGLFLGQLALGLVNMLLLAPVGLQLAHLLVADAIWIAMILLSVSALSLTPSYTESKTSEPSALSWHGRPARAGGTNSSSAGVEGVLSSDVGRASVLHGRVAHATFRDWVKAYVALTKPRVISLLLFTTATAMFMAAKGWPGGWLFLTVMLGGYMAAGAANALNMAVERDLDEAMERTATRPTVTTFISSAHAVWFALAMASGSFGLLWAGANLLSACLALAGLLFYFFIYTLLLKRRTWQNIVIGGAAGAFPPLVGWAAVTGDLSALAWVLFAIIFVWTPVHFWALALLLKEDYAKAGVPMLPVVRGEHYTALQIILYTFLTAAVSVLPLVMGEAGRVYLGAVVLLNSLLMLYAFRLLARNDRPHASRLFHYSMAYLALLFLAIAIDRFRIY